MKTMHVRGVFVVGALLMGGASNVSAQQAPPAPPLPTVVRLPTATLRQIYAYLVQRPFQEVDRMVLSLEACVSAQLPDARGIIVDRGGCPELRQANQGAEKPKDDARPDEPAKK